MVITSSLLWWTGICVVFALLIVYLLWSARQMVANEELYSLNATLIDLRKRTEAWKTGFMDGMISPRTSLMDLMLELKTQLSHARTIEEKRWTSNREILQEFDVRLKTIESKMGQARKILH